MSFELEFNTVKATSASEALVASIEKIGPSLTSAAASLSSSTDRILTSLNAIRATSKGVATDFAGISASIGSVQAKLAMQMEAAANKQMASQIRLQKEMESARRTSEAAELAALARKEKEKERIWKQADALQLAGLSKKQQQEEVMWRTQDAKRSAADNARLATETRSMMQAQNLQKQMLAQKLATEEAALARQNRSMMQAQALQKQAFMQHQAAEDTERMKNLRSQSAAETIQKQMFQQHQATKLQTQKVAHAAELNEEKKQAGLLQHAERDRHRASLINQNRFFSQSAAAFRAGMIATGSSFGIFTSSTIVTAAAVFGLVASFKAAIVIGAQFEHTMTKALAVMEVGKGSSVGTQITDQVRELAKTTQYTAVQVAEGLVFLGMAGLDASQAMAALGPALNIAAIGMVDMAFAADLITNVMNEFHMGAEDLGHIADVLAKASVDANVSIQDLGTSLSYVGPVAATSNNSLEATAALISVLGDNAIKGSRAGTTLRGSINDLLDPTAGATETLLRLGVRVKTVSGEMLPLIDIINQLASLGATSEQLSSIFDLRSLAGMTVLVKDAAKGFDESGKAIDGYVSKAQQYEAANMAATGSADELRKTMEDTLKVDALLLKSAAADQLITAFDSIGGGLRNFVQGWTEFVLAISPEKMQEIANGVVGVVKAIGLLAAAGASIFVAVKLWGIGASALSLLGAAATVVLTPMLSLPAAGTAAATAMQTLGISSDKATASLVGATTASRAMSLSLTLLQRAFVPLLIIGTVAGLIWSYHDAAKSAAETSALSRNEMALQAKATERLAGQIENLTEKQMERARARSLIDLDGNRQASATLRAEIAEMQEEEAARESVLAATADGAWKTSYEAKLGLLQAEITGREELLEQMEAETIQLQEIVRTGTNPDVVKTIEERAAAEKKAADAARLTADSYMEALFYVDRMMTLQAQDASTYVTDPSSRPLSMSLSGATSFEVDNSKHRIKLMEDEISVKEDLQEAYVSKTLISLDDNARSMREREQRALDMRAQYAAETFNTAKAFLDAELQIVIDNKDALRHQMSTALMEDDGTTLEAVIPEYKATADYINELLQQREELVSEYTTGNAEMLNSQLAFDVETTKSIRSLAESFDPLLAAENLRKQNLQQLSDLLEIQAISETAHAAAVQLTEEAYRAVLFPVDVFIEKAREKIALDRAGEAATRSGNFTMLARLTLQKESKNATDDQVASYAEILRSEDELAKSNKRLEDQAKLFERSWVQAADRVDQSFEDLWKNGMKGFESFSDQLKESFIQLMAFLAHQAITKPILIKMGMDGVSLAQQAANGEMGLSSIMPEMVTTGAGKAADWLGIGSGAASFVGGTGKAVISNAQYVELMGGKSAGMFSGVSVPTGATAIKSGIYGMAGGWAGTKVGESLFNKEAESSWGATIGGIIGGLTPLGPLGAAIGAAFGGMLDAMTGGDGKKRISAGFSVGAPAVKDDYEYGTTQFDSGLTVTNIARRVDETASDSVIDYFKTLDSAFATATRAAGVNLNMKGASLNGTTADEGIDGPGSFFGLKAFNGLDMTGKDAEEALKSQGVDFVKQLITHVTKDMNEDIKGAVNSATGSAEEIITRYANVLSLDQVFRSGNTIFTNIDNFADTLHLLDNVFRINEESLSETAERVMSASSALTALGMGDGTSDSATRAIALAEASGGVETFTAMVATFVESVAWEEQGLSESIGRLRNAVSKQFSDLGLVLEDFDLPTFKTHFDAVKDSLNDVDVVELIRAGNALAVLVAQEKELADVREEMFKDVKDILNDQAKVADSVRTLTGSIRSDILELSGVTELFPVTGTPDDQLEALENLHDQIMDQYKEQEKLEEDLHKEKVDNYKALIKASEKITDTLKDLPISDISPLTSKQKRDKLLGEFNELYGKAMGGDSEAADEISGVAKEFLKIERERETISDTFLASYADITGRLGTLQSVLASAQDPGKFKPSDSATVAITKLTELQSTVSDLQTSIAEDTLAALLETNADLKNLPKEIADKLRDVLGPELLQLLEMGQNFSLLSSGLSDLAQGLGMLPDSSALSSVSIAQNIEQLTKLSQFPFLLGQSFSATVGLALTAMARAGVPVPSIADAVAASPALTTAWNEYAGNNGYQPVDHYTSNVNPDTSAVQQVVDNAQAVLGSSGQWSSDPATMLAQAAQIISAAQASGVGSTQAANAWNAANPGRTPVTSQDLNSLAAQAGLPAFARGGLVSSPTFGLLGEGSSPEYVAPVDKYAVVERQQIVRDIAREGQTNNQAVVDAIDRHTKALTSGGAGQPIHITVVTEDGTVLVDKTIKSLRDRSENGEYIVNVKGVKQR